MLEDDAEVRGSRWWWLVLTPAGRGVVVLLQHAGGDAPALTDRQAVLFRPNPDIAAALTVRCGPPGTARLGPPRLAGVLKIGCEVFAERGGVLGVQVDLIVGAVEGEPHRLLRRSTGPIS